MTDPAVQNKDDQAIIYNPNRLPPRRNWKHVVHINRKDLGSFCERLNILVSEKMGGAFYNPHNDLKENICRYEWNREFEGSLYGLRIGIYFTATKNDLQEIEGFYTTRSLIDAEDGIPPSLPHEIEQALIQETSELIELALTKDKPEDMSQWDVLFYMDTPYTLVYPTGYVDPNGLFKIFNTRILNQSLKRITPIMVTVYARSKEAAKPKAAQNFMHLLALLTLAHGFKHERTNINWPDGHKFEGIWISGSEYNTAEFYPSDAMSDNLEQAQADTIQKLIKIVSARRALSDDAWSNFLPSLLAYYMAAGFNTEHSTLATIAHIAALSALSKNKLLKCEGDVTCSVCGGSQHKHDLISETMAITHTVIEICQITVHDQQIQLQKLIRDVHRHQRSAFVHAATLRHNEFSRNEGTISATPSEKSLVQEAHIYSRDLSSISRLTRRFLIDWMMKQSGQVTDYNLFSINGANIISDLSPAGSITLPANTLVRIAV